MKRTFQFVTGFAIAAAAAAAHADTPRFAFDDPAFDAVTADRLETFRGERDFRRYLERVSELRRERIQRLRQERREPQARQDAGPAEPRFVLAAYQAEGEPAADPCPPDDPDCNEDAEEVIVTAQMSAGPPASITNVQSAGVDEGDIVKQIGRFLLVLQDARIFVVDTGDEQGALRLADRIDVYRPDDVAADWYDEMLVEGDRIIVTAYSYREDATELSIFRIDRETGRLSRDGVFYITSDDYYSGDNYATRIIGENLIVYTPYRLDYFEDEGEWPVVRRWSAEEQFDADRAEGTRLFDARAIYRPLQRTSEPWIHSVSVCPLGDAGEGRDLDCRTTAFVGPEGSEFFVSPDDIFVWLWPADEDVDTGYWPNRNERLALAERCETIPHPARAAVMPSAIYRIPVDGREPGVIGVNGWPFDQFSMDSRDGEFRALANWMDPECLESSDAPLHLAFLRARLDDFGDLVDRRRDARYTPLPQTGSPIIENRFADDYLVYGGRQSWSSRPPRRGNDPEDSDPVTARVVTVPVRHPERAVVTELPHNIVRAERVGAHMMLDGYRDESGLHMTLLELGETPRIASSVFLPRRFESEGRSHAFNSLVGEDGSGMIGVPTVYRPEDSNRYWWRSDASDLSYLTMAADLSLAHAGELRTSEEDPTDESYSCEESCIDWYGNSRPIFTMGRTFGLMGVELVEGRLVDGRMTEVGRLNLTAPVGTAARAAPADPPPPAATVVESPAALARLRGNSGITLQWISWDYRGHVVVTDEGGLVHLHGSQAERGGDGLLELDGDVLRIDADSFTFRGRITIADAPDPGTRCDRDGVFEFRITQNRRYWRLQQMEACYGLTDYVDIYF